MLHIYQALRRGWVELARKSDRWSILRKPRRKQQLAKRMVSRPVIDPVLLLLLGWGEYTLPLIVVRRLASQQSSEDRFVIAEAKDDADDEEEEDEDTTDAEQSLRS